MSEEQQINLSDAADVQRWCVQLGCTEQQLRAAAAEVGADVEWVREYILKRFRRSGASGLRGS